MIALLAAVALAPWLLLGLTRPRAALYAAAATSGIVSISVSVGFNLVPAYLCIFAATPAVIVAILRTRLHRVDVLILLFAFFYLLITAATYGDAPEINYIGASGRNSREFRPIAQSLALLVMVIAYLAGRLLVVDRRSLTGVLRWWRLGGAAVLAYAYYQLLAYYLQLPFQFVNSRRGEQAALAAGVFRANSTLTEPTTLAQFLLVLVAVHVSLCALRRVKVGLSFLVLTLGAIALTASRAALLGLAVFAVAALSLSYLTRSADSSTTDKPEPNKAALRRLAVAAVFIVPAIMATPIGAVIQDRIVAVQGGSERFVRAGYWYSAIDIFQANPLGVGLGNYTFYYFRHLPPAESFQISYEVTDAHNVLLDYLVEGGVLTLGAYVLAILTLVASVYRLAKRPDTPAGVRQAAIVLTSALLAALAMQLTFSFFYLVYIWLLTGVIAACTSLDWREESAA